ANNEIRDRPSRPRGGASANLGEGQASAEDVIVPFQIPGDASEVVQVLRCSGEGSEISAKLLISVGTDRLKGLPVQLDGRLRTHGPVHEITDLLEEQNERLHAGSVHAGRVPE